MSNELMQEMNSRWSQLGRETRQSEVSCAITLRSYDFGQGLNSDHSVWSPTH